MAIEIPSATTKPASGGGNTLKHWREILTARPVSEVDVGFFTERLALLLETGNPLYNSLEILEKQAGNPRMVTVIHQVREEVSGGLPFSQALAHHPGQFSHTYVNLIAASEQAGFMPEVLHQLMELDERRRQLRGNLVSALSYPAFLLFFSIAVTVFVLTVVFPKFGELFESIADQLPVTTIVFMQLGDFLRLYWLSLVGATALFGLALRQWLHTEGGRLTLDRVKLGMPGLRQLIVPLYLSQVMRVMSLSLGNGVSVLDTLRACHEVAPNRQFTRFITDLEHNVEQGQGLAVGFEHTAFIPDLTRQMIATGEQSGNLPLVTGRIADFYEREIRRRITIFAKVAEPVMLLVMGALVGIIVSSLVLPIFKLSRAVH